MPDHAGPQGRAELATAYRAYLHAMREGDTDALDDLLDAGFTLTHIPGYVQLKAEWLAQMRTGQFAYHSVSEQDIDLAVDGDRARVVGRIITGATVYGSRANWRLRLSLDYARVGDVWTALRAVATTW